MPVLRKIEVEAIRLMAGDSLSTSQVSLLENYAGQSEYKYTGCGYYLSIDQLWLPDLMRTLSEPAVVGSSGEVRCGFVVHLKPHRLVLECHTRGEIDVPPNFREQSVLITTPEITQLESK